MSTIRKLTLPQCCEIVSGATPKTSIAAYWDGDIYWATPKDLSDLQTHYISETPRKITKAGLESCAAAILPPQSVLFSSRAPIGHVAINTVPMATNQGFKSFVPKPEILDAKFLYYWLRMNRSYLESLGNGATFKEVSKATVSRIEISLPPLPEQRRIAAILDQADALRAKRREALAQLDSLTQSIFIEIFGDALRSNERLTLRDLIDDFRYGTSNKSGTSGYPALRIPNVASGSLDLTELKTVEVDAAEFQRLRLRDGDVLFVRTNGNPDFVGRCAVFNPIKVMYTDFDSSEFIYASYLIRARLKKGTLLPVVLQEYLSTMEGRRALRARCKTSAGQFNINTEGLGALPIPRFPMQQQEAFIHQKQAIEQQQFVHQASLAELDALFISLQHRAFRGDIASEECVKSIA